MKAMSAKSSLQHNQSDSNPPLESLIIVGRIGAPYGVRGWNHLQSFTKPLENILQHKHWHLKQKDQWVLHEIAAGRKQGDALVVQLQGNDDRDKAALFTQCHVAILRSALPAPSKNEFYWADLEGLAVQDPEGKSLGTLLTLYENAGSDIMIIKDGDKEQHVPFVMNDTVLKVDLEAKIIVVDWL
jgi:16S rRNA processing protein RimM